MVMVRGNSRLTWTVWIGELERLRTCLLLMFLQVSSVFDLALATESADLLSHTGWRTRTPSMRKSCEEVVERDKFVGVYAESCVPVCRSGNWGRMRGRKERKSGSSSRDALIASHPRVRRTCRWRFCSPGLHESLLRATVGRSCPRARERVGGKTHTHANDTHTRREEATKPKRSQYFD